MPDNSPIVSPDILPAIFGMVDARFRVERISGDAEALFERPLAELVGSSLLELVAVEHMSHCLAALTEAVESQESVNLQLGVRGGVPGPILVQVGFVPLQPSTSCAFIFLPLLAGRPHGLLETRISAMLYQVGRGGVVKQRNGLGEAGRGFRGLTERETEIVTYLLDGHRVPAIAGKLFLSQSTVRTHLASVFVKLGVSSQQQLLDSFR